MSSERRVDNADRIGKTGSFPLPADIRKEFQGFFVGYNQPDYQALLFFENFTAIETGAALTDVNESFSGAVIGKSEQFFLAVTDLSARNFEAMTSPFIESLNHSQLAPFGK